MLGLVVGPLSWAISSLSEPQQLTNDTLFIYCLIITFIAQTLKKQRGIKWGPLITHMGEKQTKTTYSKNVRRQKQLYKTCKYKVIKSRII